MTKMIEVFTVKADVDTGEWMHEPESTGGMVDLDTWHYNADIIDVMYHDTYEVIIDGVEVTRAIVINFTE